MAQHNNLGLEGEAAAVNFLKEKGYTIVEQNWRYRKYEVDIIATDNGSLVFIEVKTRASGKWGNPEEAVDETRIRRIVDAADYYVKECDIDMPVRFDVISVIGNNGTFEITHYDDAFLAPIN